MVRTLATTLVVYRSDRPGRRGYGRAGRALVSALVLATLAACGTSGGEPDGGADEGTGRLPAGPAACAAAVLSTQSLECSSGCGPLICVYSDTAADRCNTISCVQDSDCQAEYGSLCTDVQWVCAPYITSDDRRCNVRAVSTGGTGIPLCDAIAATSGCGSEHVDRCTQGWPAQRSAHPECASQIDAVMGCFASQPITCRRDGDVAIGFGTDPDHPVEYTPGLYSTDAFGVLWYPGTACGAAASAWNRCISP